MTQTAQKTTVDMLKPGMRVSTSGYEGSVVRIYCGNMVEVRLRSGVCCVDAGDIQIMEGR